MIRSKERFAELLISLREQRRARLGEPHIGPALVQPQPAVGDGALKPGRVLGRCAVQFEQERPVDLLDIDAPVLHRLKGIGEFEQLAGGNLGIGEGSFLNKPSWLVTSRF